MITLSFLNLRIYSIPPMPNNPEHPETPPSKIPIPGEPTAAGKMHTHEYKCKICGKVFNSKKELSLHMKTEHAKTK
jgi:hypothetical protein